MECSEPSTACEDNGRSIDMAVREREFLQANEDLERSFTEFLD
jgi:hypothetical protein